MNQRKTQQKSLQLTVDDHKYLYTQSTTFNFKDKCCFFGTSLISNVFKVKEHSNTVGDTKRKREKKRHRHNESSRMVGARVLYPDFFCETVNVL